MQVNNCIPETDNRHLRLRLKVDSSTITSNNYRYAMQRVTASTENEHYAGDTKVWLVYNMGSSTVKVLMDTSMFITQEIQINIQILQSFFLYQQRYKSTISLRFCNI